MYMNNKGHTSTILLQIATAAGLTLLPPLMTYSFTLELPVAMMAFRNFAAPLCVSFILFMLNYWWIVPAFYYKGRKSAYLLVNFLLFAGVLLAEALKWWHRVDIPWHEEQVILIAVTTFCFTFLFFSGAAALAMAMRNSARAKALKEQIEEEKQRHTEAELVWLKNQLNPHFLFNTLNNISALIAFDADRAQECISRLSDLLRYAMYESAKQTVPLSKEVDFMKDYIALMSLRCNNRTSITERFELGTPSAGIAPLLLVSLIENSFKHGVSTSRPSAISISLIERDGTLTFECSNTNHAKGPGDNSGSSIGLPNTRRRLDLLYAGRYEWTHVRDENTFSVKIKIIL